MKTENLPAISDQDMAQALQHTADDAGSGGTSDVDFMNFSGKTGKYQVGQSRIEPDPDQVYLVEPASVLEGWICWKASKPVGRHEWLATQRAQRAVPSTDLEDHSPYRDGEGWSALIGFGMLTLDEAAKNIKFTVNSISASNALGDLIREISQRMAAGEPYMPVIGLGVTEFTAQDQKNFKPVLEVDVWVTRAAAAAYFDGELSEDDLLNGVEPKKKRTRRKK